MEELFVKSSLDGSLEPSFFKRSKGFERRPLLVVLHTWSYDRYNMVDTITPYADKYNYNVLFPEFRGPNLKSNPRAEEACGSELARRDIYDAVKYVCGKYDTIDENNIFLLGMSGGGHMALLMAGYAPEMFKSVTAFVPITNLADWAKQSAYYGEHIKACCGDDETEMLRRSPVSYLDNIAKTTVKLFHGKNDDTVPVEQSIGFYMQMLEKHPEANVYLDIFPGGHDLDPTLAFHFINTQYEQNGHIKVTG